MNAPKLVPIVVVGARGRMGMELIRAVLESDDLTLVGAVDRTGAPGVGLDAARVAGLPASCGVEVSGDLRPPRGSVVVDFSLPGATANNLDRCLEASAPLVLGTTGLDEAILERLRSAAADLPIVSAANFSVGVTLLLRLAAMATAAVGAEWDAEVVEIHHRHKRDAPSGTALRLAKAVARAAGSDPKSAIIGDRGTRPGPRRGGEVGVAALRGGDSIGEHTIFLFGEGERLELSHRATDRGIFARGALRAARWLHGRPSGLYDMPDVLGI